MPRPHDIFKFRTADDVAESWDGVSPSLYKALWNDIALAAHMTINFPDDDYVSEDVDACTSLAQYWDRLSEEHQVELNDLAYAEVAEA